MSDLISRQEAIDALDCISGVEEVLRSLPSVQPERKTGHWIEHKTQIADHTVYTYECSECGNSMLVKPTRFCGHCGLKMEEANDDPE